MGVYTLYLFCWYVQTRTVPKAGADRFIHISRVPEHSKFSSESSYTLRYDDFSDFLLFFSSENVQTVHQCHALFCEETVEDLTAAVTHTPQILRSRSSIFLALLGFLNHLLSRRLSYGGVGRTPPPETMGRHLARPLIFVDNGN